MMWLTSEPSWAGRPPHWRLVLTLVALGDRERMPDGSRRRQGVLAIRAAESMQS